MNSVDKRRILAAQNRAELMVQLSERGFYILNHRPLPVEAHPRKSRDDRPENNDRAIVADDPAQS